MNRLRIFNLVTIESMKKIRIIEAGNELGLGGTEYVIQLISKFLNKEYFEVTVLGLHHGGERVKVIENLGIPVVVANGDMNSLAQMLSKTDVFHWHGSGLIDEALFKVIQANKPPMVIQTNVFGLFSYTPLYDLIDYDLFVSKMILVRRMYIDSHYRNIMPSDLFVSKRKVLHNPIDTDHIISVLPAEAEIRKFKHSNNLQDNFVVGRIGRSDNCKFDLVALDGFAAFAEQVTNARFLLVGATPEILAHAAVLNITEKLIVLDTTTDLQQLLIYYQSLDVFLAASHIGESFGMVIAEAMTAGVPVVTISTDDKDNAQVELVDNNVTGLVVERSKEKISAALLHLYHDEKTRTRLSGSSRNKVIKEYQANKIVASLEALIFNHLQVAVPSDILEVSDQNSLVLDYSIEMVNDYVNRANDLWEDTNSPAQS